MKTLLSLLLITISLSLSAQTVDTTVKDITAVKVVPFKARFTDTTNATHLGVKIVSDDLKTQCVLYWELLSTRLESYIDKVNGVDVQKTIIRHDVLQNGNVTISGADYTNWTAGSNTYPFVFIASKFGLTFKN